jgi:REP element-mobilizing transposase RayT
MAQSFSSILLHIVFSTKNREPLIMPGIEPELFSYMNKLYKVSGSPCLTINGTPDHVHALCSLGRTTTVAELVEVVKKRSSKWIKTEGARIPEFSVADRIRCLLNRPVKCPAVNKVYCETEGAP